MSKSAGDIVTCLISHLHAFVFVLCNTYIVLCDSFVWGTVEWSQEMLWKVQCLVLFQLFYSSGWFSYTIVYTEYCFTFLLTSSWLTFGICNCSSASLDSVLIPLRGMRELWQSVCGLSRNLSFLGDDQGDACCDCSGYKLVPV